jgi:hypothetical protein
VPSPDWPRSVKPRSEITPDAELLPLRGLPMARSFSAKRPFAPFANRRIAGASEAGNDLRFKRERLDLVPSLRVAWRAAQL